MITRKFLAVSLGVLALSVGVCVMDYQGSAQAASPTDQILAALSQLQAAVSSLQTQVSSLQTQVNGLATQGNLSGVTQNWDKNLPSGSRFTVLAAFNNQAVRDNNTGLVWERGPDITIRVWSAAGSHCLNGVPPAGWRLPSVVELQSFLGNSTDLVSVFFDPTAYGFFWSATTEADHSSFAYSTGFNTGVGSLDKNTPHPAWCVCGDMNTDQY